jgi:hypothetical protein
MITYEKELEKKFGKMFKRTFPMSKYIKFRDGSRRAAPDRLLLMPRGFSVFIEFKKPLEHPRPDQLEYHNRLQALGYFVFVIDSEGKFKQVIDTLSSMFL